MHQPETPPPGLLAQPNPERSGTSPPRDVLALRGGWVSANSESEEQLRQVVRLSQIGIFEHNHLTGEFYWSPEHRKMFGWRLDEPVVFTEAPGRGWEIWDVVHPDDRARTAAGIKSAHAGENGGLFDIEYRIIRRDGSLRWISTRSQTFFEGEGDARHPVRTVGAVQDITAHKMAERRYRYMQTSVDRCNTAIYWVSPDGLITYANDSACRSLGRTATELSRLHVWDFDPNVAREGWPAVWQSVKQKKTRGLETFHQRKDGTTFPVDVLGNYIEIDGEEHLFVFAQDASKRRTAEQALRESEEQLRQLTENMRDMLCRVGPDGRFEYVSPSSQTVLGCPPSQLLGEDMLSRVHADDVAEVSKGLRQVLQEGRPLRRELRYRRRDGHYLWVESVASAIKDADGNIAGAVVSTRDITQRVEARTQLSMSLAKARALEIEQERNARRFHDLFEFSPDALVMSDHDGSIRLVNRKAEAMFGWSRDELIGRDIDALTPEADYENRIRFRAQFVRALSDPSPATERPDLRARRKDGTSFPVEINLGPIETGDSVMIAAAIRDITERRNAERHASRAQRLESIGTLAGGIAHDLNNALTPILMTIDLLKQQHPQEHELLDTVEQSASHAAEMVRHLLAFAKGSEGKRVALQPGRLLEEIAKIVKGTFPKNIDVRVRALKELPAISGDATQLHQVLLNLCVNARDAMPAGGTLTLEADCVDSVPDDVCANGKPKAGRYVVLRVADSGVGIAPDVLERIFEPFFTTKEPDSGTGLGLFTVAGIVKGHGGVVRVTSQLGKGAAFAVYVPAQAQAGDVQSVRLTRSEYRGHGEYVLYVDDEPTVCEAARTVLQTLHFTPLVASDGTGGLIQAVQYRGILRAIVTDLHMPNMDGLAFVRAVRRALPNVPIVVASGRLEPVPVQEFRRLGVDVMLEKPFTQGTLAEALRTVLTKSPSKTDGRTQPS